MSLKVASISDALIERRRENAARLRDCADQVENGDITEFVFVANTKAEGCFMAHGAFDDRWRILGALEYAKQTVHEN
jgi:hypothetical protein